LSGTSSSQISWYVRELFDLEYTICFFLYDAWTGTDVCLDVYNYIRPILSALPFLWRFLQCLRRARDLKDKKQYINAGKYSFGFVVIFFSVMRASVNSYFLYPWILSLIVNTFYAFIWDIKMDWSLSFRHLREKLLYPKQVYYVAIMADFVLRCAWTLTISPQSFGIILNPLILASILAAVELCRRAMWNIFRLENEELNNIGKFRVVKDLPIAVEHMGTDDILIEMHEKEENSTPQSKE